MTDSDRRSRVHRPERAGETAQWEVFIRERPTDDLRHAGSVTAATVESAHDHAGTLFDDPATVWLCPASELTRFSVRTLGEESA
ncbi:MAG: Htur_1727 family rSAM-partnered candidate RiPP [Natronomonas sp.]